MADKSNYFMSESSPLSLLVFAANAQSQTENEEDQDAAASLGGSQGAMSMSKAPSAGQTDQQNLAQLEFQEALQREAYQREAYQQEALQQEALQRRAAALMAHFGGMNGLMANGIPPQEQEYLQQLRLEALVQQRRQETLAQLALAQESSMSQDFQALLNAQQQRQAALMRQELLLGGQGGGGGFQPSLDHLGALRGRMGATEESALLQYLEDKERQRKLATPAPVVSGVFGAEATLSADLVGSSLVKSADEAERGDEAAQESSKTTVLPCRARGMPMDHNVKTAYFVIPDDIKHGTELVCSYYACRNAGIKFRYCTYCKLPVAKRNFCKRHKHTGKIAAENIRKDAEGSGEDDLSNSESIREGKKTSADKSKEDVLSQGSKQDSKPSMKVTKEPKIRRKVSKKKDAKFLIDKLLERGVDELVTQEGEADKNGPKNESLPSDQMEKLVENRRDAWEQLLRKRPRSETDESMVSWAQKVLAVSDFDTPCEGEEDIPPVDTKKDEEEDEEEDSKDAKDDEEDSKDAKDEEEDTDMKEEQDNNSDSKSDEDDASEEKEKEQDDSDEASTSSESLGSVDLRASKKMRGA